MRRTADPAPATTTAQQGAGLRARLWTTVAGQLGHPHGRLGRVVAVALDRGNRPAVTGAVRLSAAAAGEVVADLGFGGGLGLSTLLDRVGDDGVVHGVEVSRAMLDRARSRHVATRAIGRLRLAHGSLTALPLPDQSLDAAITVNTLYFVDDIVAVCAELARVLRPLGRLVVGIGDPDAMARLPTAPYGFVLRPVDEVIEAFRQAGFTLMNHEQLTRITIPHHLLAFTRRSGDRR